MPNLDDIATLRLAELTHHHRLRQLTTTEPQEGMWVVRHGKRLLNFSSNDYLGLTQDNRIKQASADAALRYGTGAGASRHVTGTHSLYEQVETMLASMKHTEDAVIFGNGYLTNLGVIPTLVGKGDAIVLDKACHACIYDGARLSGATILRYHHNNLEDLFRVLKERNCYTHTLICTETIFSMDGDAAPLTDILTLAQQHDAWVLTDDAHGFGLHVPQHHADIQIGTLSKAVGSYGGYVAGSKSVIHLIKQYARSLMFTTALPPATIAATLEALKIIQQEPWRADHAIEHARFFCTQLNLPQPHSTIVPLIIGEEKATLSASQHLEEAGFLVHAIRPPTVPYGTSRLRITFSSAHSKEDVQRLVEAIQTL